MPSAASAVAALPAPVLLSSASDGSAFAVCVLTPQWRHKADSEPPPTAAELDAGDVLVAVGRGDGSIDVRSVLTGQVVHRLIAHKMSVIDLVTTPYDFCGSTPAQEAGASVADDARAPQRTTNELLSPLPLGVTSTVPLVVPASGVLAAGIASQVLQAAAAPASAIAADDEDEEDDAATPGVAASTARNTHSDLPPPRSLAPMKSQQQLESRRRAWSHDRSSFAGQLADPVYHGSGGMSRRKWQTRSSRPPLSFGSGSVFKPPTLLSVGRDGTLRSWDVVSGKQKAAAHHGAPVWTLVAYGPRVYTGGADGRIRVWSARTGRAVASFHVRRQVVCLAVIGETVLAGTNNGNLVCIDAITGEQLWVKKLFRDRCAVRRLVLDCAATRVVAVSQFGSLASIDLEL
jgi:hypothetical protein